VNLLQDTTAFPTSLADYFLPPTQIVPTHSSQRAGTIRLAGPIGSLPGGQPTLAMLLESSRDKFSSYTREIFLPGAATFTTFYTEQDSRTNSAYLEARLPIVGKPNSRRALQALEFQVSGRFDDYRMNGGREVDLSIPEAPLPSASNRFTSFNPTIGVRLQPIEDVTIRASYGTGFRPPALSQLQPFEPSIVSPPFIPFIDPRRGGESVGDVLVESGGSADLNPEESTSVSAGIILTPRILPGFRASMDWVRIKKRDNITQVFFDQTSIDNEGLLLGVITRAAPAPGDPFSVGPITGFDASLINGTRALFESIDFTLDYEIDTARVGTFALSGAATRLIHRQEQVLITLPFEERADLLNSPTWNSSLTLSWQRQPVTLAWTAQYVDSAWLSTSHQFSVGQGSARVESAVFHDIFGAYRFPTAGSQAIGLLSNLEIRAGLKNIFDSKPGLVATLPNFYDNRLSPAGLTYYVTVKKDL
jgi:iron complex outermembrane recepter protein